MPIKKCKINGKKGYKYGNRGKCYTQRKNAVIQGRAIEISKHRK